MSEGTHRVVVRYDHPHAGTWRGPAESRDEAMKRLEVERARVHGTAWIEEVGRP